MIRLQDTTPSVYYNQSRDFQYIGRLFDIVLNSVKTNADLLYTIPISDNSDEKLLDLMTLTLGFKSKHNYNVKQLSALCSAFAYVIRNKGNIKSIITACNTLINAEGITKEADYSLSDDCTCLRLFLPIELTDTNLLKDLLVYILPAGMECEIIREATVRGPQTITEGATTDTVRIFSSGTYSEDEPTLYDNNALAIVPQLEEDDVTALTNAFAEDTAGVIGNGGVYQPADPEPEQEP